MIDGLPKTGDTSNTDMKDAPKNQSPDVPGVPYVPDHDINPNADMRSVVDKLMDEELLKLHPDSIVVPTTGTAKGAISSVTAKKEEIKILAIAALLTKERILKQDERIYRARVLHSLVERLPRLEKAAFLCLLLFLVSDRVSLKAPDTSSFTKNLSVLIVRVAGAAVDGLFHVTAVGLISIVQIASLSSSRVRDQSKNSRRASSQLPSNRILEKSQSSPTPRTGKSQEAACQLDTQLYKRNGHRLTPPSLDYSLLSSPSAGGIFENRDEHFGQNAHVRSHRSVFPRHILRSFLEHFTLSYRLGFPPDLSHQANSLDW
ncbi:hypothetical protein RIF29_48109 [Crotalaria pallida]